MVTPDHIRISKSIGISISITINIGISIGISISIIIRQGKPLAQFCREEI